MIRYPRDPSSAVAWLLLAALILAGILLLATDTDADKEWQWDRQRTSSSRCLAYYLTDKGASGTYYVNCE